jgi:hypothetical protein
MCLLNEVCTEAVSLRKQIGELLRILKKMEHGIKETNP